MRIEPGHRSASQSPACGYILLEAVLALMIFGIAVVGLTGALNATLEVTNTVERDALVRQALSSFAAEVKAEEDLGSMSREEYDEISGIRFNSEVEQLALSSGNERPLSNLYELVVTATYQAGGRQRSEEMRIYLHRSR